jgi:hypothetical protein
MTFAKRTLMILVVALAVTGGLWAQRPSHGGGMNPMAGMPSFGLQNPIIGSGSEYLMTTNGREMDMAIVALGKEDVGGQAGYWMEMRMTSQDLGGEMVMKTLVVSSATEQGVKRMIMQRPGQPPMEMPAMMMNMMQQHQTPPITTKGSEGGPGGAGELVGTESVTVPAGTFSCQHYRKQDPKGMTDLWISTQVTPYAMVKMTGQDANMVLKKILTNETSHIKGEPQKMQFPGMPQ